MKAKFPERIIDMLRAEPDGLTSKDIAERLGTTAGSIGSRLSKLAAYGIIGKTRAALLSNGSRATVYRALNLEPQQSGRPSEWNSISQQDPRAEVLLASPTARGGALLRPEAED